MPTTKTRKQLVASHPMPTIRKALDVLFKPLKAGTTASKKAVDLTVGNVFLVYGSAKKLTKAELAGVLNYTATARRQPRRLTPSEICDPEDAALFNAVGKRAKSKRKISQA